MNEHKETSAQFVLLRGLARESRHWGQFPKLLSDSLQAASGERVRVDAIDLPGTGRFSEMKSPVSMGENATFAREKLLELRIRMRETGEIPPREMYLVAISLGGMVASRWLERWPDDFRGTVLINTSFKGYSPFYRRLAPQSYLQLANILRGREPRARESAVLRLVSNRPDLFDATVEEWTKIQSSRPVSYENFARQLIAASRFSSELRTPPVPVLLLASQGDRLVHPSCSEEIADRWHSEIRRHPTAGHDLPHDDGPWVAAQIADWWKHLIASRAKSL